VTTLTAHARHDEQTGGSKAALGTIAGVVLDGHDETSVPEAVVSITGRIERQVAVSQQVLTDDRGRFVFRDLPAASYQIEVGKADYASRRLVTGGRSSFPYLSLAAGESLSDVRTWLWRHASVSGRVVDERGEPMVGTPVRAFAEVFIGGRARYVAAHAAVTDDRGEYYIADLPAHDYVVVWFPRPGGLGVAPPADSAAALAYPAVYYPGTRDSNAAIRVTVEPGQERRGVDLRVEPVPTGRIQGRLEGSLNGLVGLRLRLRLADAVDLGFGYETATAEIQSDGSFGFQSVPAGRYLIEALSSHYDILFGSSTGASNARKAAGLPLPEMWGRGRPIGFGGGMVMASAAGDLFFSNSGRAQGGWVRSAVEVRASETEQVVVPVHPTGSLSGRVILEDSPTVAATTYAPDTVALTLLRVEPADPSFGLTHANHRANADGSFHIGGLLPGEYYVTGGGLGRTVKSVMWNGRDYADRPFDASAGQDFSGIVVTLTSRHSRFPLTGTVRDGQGRGVPSAAVAVFPADRSLWDAYGVEPRRLGSVMTTESGAFQVSGFSGFLSSSPLPAGDHCLIAVRHLPVDWMRPTFLEAVAGLARCVSVDWDQTRSVALELRDVVR
jgi:hypothetical protein